MLTLTILHELEVDDLIDSTGMYLGAASVFAVGSTTVRTQMLFTRPHHHMCLRRSSPARCSWLSLAVCFNSCAKRFLVFIVCERANTNRPNSVVMVRPCSSCFPLSPSNRADRALAQFTALPNTIPCDGGKESSVL